MKRTALALAATLALIVLALALGERADDERARRSGAGPLADFEPARVHRLRVRAAGSTWQLTRTDAGFRVDGLEAAADAAAVDAALVALAGIGRETLAARNPANHARLQVAGGDGPGIEVELWLGGGDAAEPDRHLYVGKPSPGGGSFVRRVGEDEVYVAPTLLATLLDRGAHGWRDPAIQSFRRERAVRIELHRSGEVIVLERAGPGIAWRLTAPHAALANPAAVEPVLRTLASLRADGFAEANEAPAVDADRSLVSLDDGRRLELLWGAPGGDGQVAVVRPRETTVYRVLEYRRHAVFPLASALIEPS